MRIPVLLLLVAAVSGCLNASEAGNEDAKAATAQTLPEGVTTAGFDHCSGQRFEGLVDRDSAQSMLPDGYTAGAVVKRTGQSQSVPGAGQFLVEGYQCKEVRLGNTTLTNVPFARIGVVLEDAAGEESEEMFVRDVYLLAWYTDPGPLLDALSAAGWPAEEAYVLQYPGSMSIRRDVESAWSIVWMEQTVRASGGGAVVEGDRWHHHAQGRSDWVYMDGKHWLDLPSLAGGLHTDEGPLTNLTYGGVRPLEFVGEYTGSYGSWVARFNHPVQNWI